MTFDTKYLTAGFVAMTLLSASAAYAKKERKPVDPRFFEPNYTLPEGLVEGATFEDRFLPVPIQGPLRSNVWGAESVVPRDVSNGIEDDIYSYWGGNIVLGEDGKNHMFCCRWEEDYNRGHYGYQESIVVHAVSDSGPLGPYRVVDVIGPGHNPEVYQAKDGSWLIGVLEDIGTYHAPNLNGPWKPHMPNFIPFEGKKANLRNRSYAKCDDGSVLMVIKNGTIWHSEDGITDFKQVSNGVYYKPDPKLPALHEDPVIWKDEVQFNMVYNDARRRQAFYMRSKDGVHWKADPGYAYRTDMMTYEGGRRELWYKWERAKVRQDRYGRATHMNFAVIDVDKKADKGNDNHSSKNVVLPLTVPCRLEILNTTPITSDTMKIRVKLKAEPGFDPAQAVDLQSLRFGASEEVNFGRGSVAINSWRDGEDLVVVFDAKGNGLTEENFAAKLIGRDRQGELLIGFAKIP